MDIDGFKVADLKRELKSRNLPVSGTKAELADRLKAAIANNEDGFGTVPEEGLPEGELSDNDESLLNEDDLLKDSVATKLDKSPAKPKGTAPSIENSAVASNVVKTASALQKEGVLLPLEDNLFGTVEPPAEKTPVPVSADKLKARAERFGLPEAKLEQRAKKFGVSGAAEVTAPASKPSTKLGGAPEVDKQKLLDRAKRFGLNVGEDGKAKPAPNASVKTPSTNAAGEEKPIISTSVKPEDLEKLRKRAERFGGNVSNIALKAEDAQKLELRKIKFGNSTVTTTPTSEATAAATEEPKEVDNGPSEPKKRKPIVF